MTPQEKMQQAGREELRAARKQSRALYWAVGIFSVFANLLMLTGPIYMLQVYDRVLGSRSVETLVALSVLVLFLYTMMALLDFARGRIMGRVSARFQATLDRRVHLFLFIKVRENWMDDPERYALWGLDPNA